MLPRNEKPSVPWGRSAVEQTLGHVLGWAEELHGRLQTGRLGTPGGNWAGSGPGARRLAFSWVVVLAAGIGAAGVLQALGPPGEAAPAMTGGKPIGTHPLAGAPARDASADIPGLLAKVQSLIAEAPDGQPPGAAAEDALRRVSDALAAASPDDRALAADVASDLFDRARSALQSGKVDEEQRWLALGAFLAPPPDLAPVDTADQGPAEQAVTARKDQREEFTPNEAEAEQFAGNRVLASRTANPSERAGAQPALAPEQPSATALAASSPRLLASLKPAQPSDTPAERPDNDARGRTHAIAGSRIAVHYLVRSPLAEAQAKELAKQLAADFDHSDAVAEGNVPPTAVIGYAGEGGHSAARELGRSLSRMGYAWHIERLTGHQSLNEPATVEAWLPGNVAFAQDTRSPTEYSASGHSRPDPRAHGRNWEPWWVPGWL